METVFRIINRINSALFLLLLLGIGGFAIYQIAASGSAPRSDTVMTIETDAGEGAKQVNLHFAFPETIIGAETIMLPLDGETRSDGLIGSKSENRETRNELFVKADGSATWLFEGNSHEIYVAIQIAETADLESYGSYEAEQPKKTPTKLLLFGFTVAGDDREEHSRDDPPMRIAFTRPDGSGMVEVMKNVDSIVADWLLPSGVLTLVYRRNATIHRAQYAIEDFREISNAQVAEIPTDR